MQQFDVAHIREQGQDLIIVFVSDQVRYMSDQDRAGLSAALTLCSHSAGLAGAVVLVWPGGFYSDRRFHAYFESISFDLLTANINTNLKCDNL